MLSTIIITKNEEKMIEDCLISLKFEGEIIVMDTGNTDRTNEIAASHKAKIIKSAGKDYSQFRNDGLKAAKSSWILYVDADERVTPLLKKKSSILYLQTRLNRHMLFLDKIFFGERNASWRLETIM